MSKSKKSLRRIDPDKLRDAIERSGEAPFRLTIARVRRIAERAGLVPPEFREDAYTLALNEVLRHALRARPDPGSVQTFFNFNVEEIQKDGSIRRVPAYKHADYLTSEEWDHVIAERVNAINADMVMCNRVVRLRNHYASEKGWRQMEIPFPAVDGDKGSEPS